MSMTTTSKESIERMAASVTTAKRTTTGSGSSGEKREVGPAPVDIATHAHTAEELAPKVFRFKTKQALYGGAILLVVVCVSGRYILTVRNQLETQKWERIAQITTTGLYAGGYVIGQVMTHANGGVQMSPPDPSQRSQMSLDV